jgi:hypothetical protein
MCHIYLPPPTRSLWPTEGIDRQTEYTRCLSSVTFCRKVQCATMAFVFAEVVAVHYVPESVDGCRHLLNDSIVEISASRLLPFVTDSNWPKAVVFSSARPVGSIANFQ